MISLPGCSGGKRTKQAGVVVFAFCQQRRAGQLEALAHRNMRGHVTYKVKQKKICMRPKGFIL